MDSEPDFDEIVGPSKDHELFCDPQNPETMVMLKNVQLMGYFSIQQTYDDGSGQKIRKYFPNYFILDNLEVAHTQKAILYCMLQQETCPEIMISQFCNLARKLYIDEHPDKQKQIPQFEKVMTDLNFDPVAGILKQYTSQSFFYRILNRLLRAGKDSTQIYYAQYFVKLLSKAITTVHRDQRIKMQKEVCGRFKCYRGAYFTDKEIEQLSGNVGKHIETLGFLSASVDQTRAKHFMANTLLEIEISGMPMDEEMNRGYAFLTGRYSVSPEQKEVLFNVLSSFQIKSVEKTELYIEPRTQDESGYSREGWLIKLEYGVTYQLMHRHKLSKHQPRGGLSSLEEQEVLSILKWQNLFKTYSSQQQCLFQEKAVEQYIWMMRTKIDICKGNSAYQTQGRLIQQLLQIYLTSNKEYVRKENQLEKRVKERIDKQIKQEHYKQPIEMDQQISNLVKAHQIIHQHLFNGRLNKCTEAAGIWQRRKQFLTSSILYHLQVPSQIKQMVEQIELKVLVLQLMANLAIYDEIEDGQKVEHEMQRMRLLKKQLKANDRLQMEYHMLNNCEINYGRKYGLMSYEEINSKMYEAAIFSKGITADEADNFMIRLLENEKQVNKHLQNKQWQEAVRMCAEFRDKKYKGQEEEDTRCFRPIIHYCNKSMTNFIQKLQLLQAALAVRHPKNSGFLKQAYDLWAQCKNYQKEAEIQYVLQATELVKRLETPPDLYNQLLYANRKMRDVFQMDSPCRITNECLIVNTLRRMGRYEHANLQLKQLKKRIRGGNNRKYYNLLKLSKFEEKEDGTK